MCGITYKNIQFSLSCLYRKHHMNLLSCMNVLFLRGHLFLISALEIFFCFIASVTWRKQCSWWLIQVARGRSAEVQQRLERFGWGQYSWRLLADLGQPCPWIPQTSFFCFTAKAIKEDGALLLLVASVSVCVGRTDDALILWF